MAKGAIAKQIVFDGIKKVFPDSFMYNNGKELRINVEEEGNPVQIKVQLTCAKEAVSPEGEVMKAAAAPSETGPVLNESVPTKLAEPSEEEKQNVEDLLAALGLN